MKRYGPLAILLASVPLLAFGPVDRVAQDQWALVIGISDYMYLEDINGGDLPGAERDARAMRDVLVGRWGVPAENVRMLLSREATRAAIEESITGWLTRSARPGDQVTVFFAGHGSQMWDESGDEDDGLDETLVPTDVRPETTEFDISDDEFGEWLNALPTDNVTVILDKCHSGTSTRDVTPFSRSRQLGRDINDIEKPPSVSRRALPGQEDQTGFDPAASAAILELSASQPHQVAVDALFQPEEGDPFHGGAFTTYLVRELWRAPSKTTYEEVFHDVTDALRRNRFDQDPQLSVESPRVSAPLFFVEGRGDVADAFLPVTEVSGDQVELAGGQALGITAGSVFTLEGGARLLIESVNPDRSQGRLLSGSADAGEKARMLAYRYPDAALRVNVGGVGDETRAALEAALGDVDDIRIIPDPSVFSHLLLRRRGNDLRVVSVDGATRHTVAVGAEGTAELAKAFKTEAAAKRLADMENLGQTFAVEVSLANGGASFGIGESVVFHAMAEREGYLTLVDLGTDGTVTILFPNPYDRDNHIQAGETITFPGESMDSEIVAQPPAGRGIVRAFLTPEPLDIPVGDDFTYGGILLADRIAEAVKATAGIIDGAPGAIRLDTWGTASLVYDIRP